MGQAVLGGVSVSRTLPVTTALESACVPLAGGDRSVADVRTLSI